MLTRDYVELWRKRKPHLQHSLHFEWELATQKHKYTNTHEQIHTHKYTYTRTNTHAQTQIHTYLLNAQSLTTIRQQCEKTSDLK